MIWNASAGKYTGDNYTIYDHGDARSRRATVKEGQLLVNWLDPHTIVQDEQQTFYAYLTVPTEVALKTLYGGPRDDAPYLAELLERTVN